MTTTTTTTRKAPARAQKAPQGVTVTLVQDRETKGTYRYAETGPDTGHVIGTLYLRKRLFTGAAPEQITVTVAF